MTQEVIQITDPHIDEAVHYIDLDDKVLGYDQQVPEAERQDAINKQTEEILSRIVAITNLIPQSAITYGLAAAGSEPSFRGNFDYWTSVPATNWDEQTLGDRPDQGDYIIVADATAYSQEEKYNGKPWRFKYTASNTIAYNRTNFVPEYNINAQFSSDQQNAINSGITSTKVGNYDSHIANNNLHISSADRTAAVDSGINSTLVAQITTNKNNIANNTANISTNTTNISTINNKIPSTATSAQKLRVSKSAVVKIGSASFPDTFVTDTDIVVTGAGTITITGSGDQDGREISIISTIDGVFLKINGDTTSGRELTANTALTFTWSTQNNKWNMLAGQGTYTNTVTLTGQYTDGTEFTFVIPAVSIN